YSKTVTAAPGAHRFYIQSLYHPGKPVYSIPHTLTVVAVVVPTIDKVNENTAIGALVPNAGTTMVTTLVISGKASAGQQLQVLKGGAVVATIRVSPAGDYSYPHVDAALGARSYTVKALYGALPVSQAWALSVTTGARILQARTNTSIPNGRIIQSGASVSISSEWGVRFFLTDVPSAHTHYAVFRDGQRSGSGPLGNPPHAEAYNNAPKTERVRVATYSGINNAPLPDGPDFVINWIR
ncbi:hypothetical protein I5P86_27865, partial [Pseudomonas glycinae]